jgi:fructosamine-3-kinase
MDSVPKSVINNIFENLKKTVENIEPIIGHGSVNKIFIVSTNKEKLIIRLNNNRGFDEFIKEKWCIEQATARGVPSPHVINIGDIQGHSYMVLSFLKGVVGSQSKIDKELAWEVIGKYTKLIHSIPVFGFGLSASELIDTHTKSSYSKWREFVEYNIQSLRPDDKLIGLGALNEEKSEKLKKLFQELIKKQFNFGLNHGDISLKNVMISDENKVSIFDWGSAEAQIVPYHDIGVILEDSLKDNSREFKSFLKGYGLSDKNYADMEEDLRSLMLLRATDKLRWAIDKHKVDIPAFTARVKEFYKMKFK